MLFLSFILFCIGVQTAPQFLARFIKEILRCNRPEAIVSLLWATVVLLIVIAIVIFLDVTRNEEKVGSL